MITTDRLVDVPGGKIFTRSWRPESPKTDEPLILLHDSVGCVDLWRELPAILAERLNQTIIAYDRLGFGRSTARHSVPSLRFMTEEAEIYFPALHRALGLKRFALFGYSVGGGMSLLIASRMPDLCNAVITESAQAFVEQHTIEGVIESQEKFAEPERFAKLAKWHGEKTQWILDAWREVWLSPEYRDWSLAPDLPRVKCPVLVIHGDEDQYGSVAFPKLIASKVGGPVEVHIFGGVGHVPHRDRKEEVLRLIASFLATLV